MDLGHFFPGVNGNLTKIMWAHAVNNRAYLQSALNCSVMMLESDVILGTINGSGDSVPIPILGHPPVTQSDLSLEEFLKIIHSFNKDRENRLIRKGIKLDFKSMEVFRKSVGLIKPLYNSIDYPVWLNANIIKGPLNASTVPLDANSFLSTAKVFNNSVLSLSWTTTAPEKNNHYTYEQIREMIEVVKRNNVKQSLIFSVRAGIAARSLDQMKLLKQEMNNCTLTIWSSQRDDVDVSNLRKLVFEYGVNRVYIDVPENLYNRLNLGNSARLTRASVVMPLTMAAVLSIVFK